MTRLATIGLALRSLLWVFLLPGMLAGYVPWRYFGVGSVSLDARDPLHWLGCVFIAAGATILGVCVYEFAHSGKGTLSPLDAPPLLVVKGLYRYVRNPMYVGVLTVVIGEALLTLSRPMLYYLAFGLILFNTFVRLYEEPTLARMFGDQYRRYKSAVPRWLPRLRPWEG